MDENTQQNTRLWVEISAILMRVTSVTLVALAARFSVGIIGSAIGLPIRPGSSTSPSFTQTVYIYLVLLPFKYRIYYTCNLFCTGMSFLMLIVLFIYCCTGGAKCVNSIDAQWEGMGDVGLERYELALLPPCPTIRVLSYSNN